MQHNFQEALAAAPDHKELPFPPEEFQSRLTRVRQAMADAGIDLLFATAPESLYYLTGFQCEWYQAQSGRPFPPTSGLAVHVDHDRTIHFETPSEAMLTAIGTVSDDVRIFPLEARRDGLPFILGELGAEGWLKGQVGLELYNYRPNPVIAERYRAGFTDAGCQVEDATDIIRNVRHIKSPLEMEALEEAARIADIGMDSRPRRHCARRHGARSLRRNDRRHDPGRRRVSGHPAAGHVGLPLKLPASPGKPKEAGGR